MNRKTAIAVALIVVAVVAFRLWRSGTGSRGARQDREGDKPLVSLVLLLKEPRWLDAAALQGLAKKAWGVELRTEDPLGENWVVGESPHFIIRCSGQDYLVNNFGTPYLEDPAEAGGMTKDLRLQKILAEHRAWLSVDRLGEPDEADLAPVWGHIGKLVAELTDDNCLALYCPFVGRINCWQPELDEMLRGPDPLEATGSSGYVPVLEVGDDDPQMQAAQAEARRRWPEFVKAFDERRPDDKFSAKGPFTDGEATEFMWVDVTAIEGDVIYGTLGNDPMSVKGIRLGDKVRLRVEDLNDWLFIRGESMEGGFTVKVLRDAQKRR